MAAFASTLPAGWTLALASRDELPLPTARMRVERRLLEIGADDLAMSLAEAARLLAAAGVELSDATTAAAGVADRGLAGGALPGCPGHPGRRGRGDRTRSPATDRLMSDYLRSEVLDRLSRSQRQVPGPYVDPGPA